MKISKISGNFVANIETKISEKGNRYNSCSVSQSVKKQDGTYEKVYFNGFPEDFLKLGALCLAMYDDFMIENTKEKFGRQNQHNQEQPQERQPENVSQEEDFEDEIPF